MKHLKLFQTNADYESATLDLPNVSYVEESKSVTFTPKNFDPFNGHEYVDLGLPSGTLWAKCNVGADSESDYGLYFSWGETVGYEDASSEKGFSWDDYKYCNGSAAALTKYNNSSSYGTVDNLTVLESSDDAASVNMGGSWRMPSNEEYQELIDNTINTWTTVNGINGVLFTGNNGNTLFFPASGICSGSTIHAIGSNSLYWNSSLSSNPPSAYYLYSFSGYCSTRTTGRYCGCPVRGVIG